MSFSGETKQELSRLSIKTKHCRVAELAAIFLLCGSYSVRSDGRIFLVLQSEGLPVIRRAGYLLHVISGNPGEVSVLGSGSWKKSRVYTLAVTDSAQAIFILRELRLMTPTGVLHEPGGAPAPALLKRECCQKAFLRGAFLFSGAISDPTKSYHLEIVCTSPAFATRLIEVFAHFAVMARHMQRRNNEVVYIKDSEGISDALTLMGAATARLAFENIRIYRSISGDVNRKVNCETANLNKTVTAGASQLEDIALIEETIGLSALPDVLREAAMIRLDNPDASLQELGELLVPPVGKSGMNHRFRKLKTMAADLKKNKKKAAGPVA